MRKLLILCLLSSWTASFAQINIAHIKFRGEKTISYRNETVKSIYDRWLPYIDEVEGQTWIALADEITIPKDATVAIVEGKYVAYRVLPNGKVQLRPMKTKMTVYDFKKKKKVKAHANSDEDVRPKNAKKKVEKMLRNQ